VIADLTLAHPRAQGDDDQGLVAGALCCCDQPGGLLEGERAHGTHAPGSRLFHPRAGIGRDQTVVHRLVECRGEVVLHQADGVGVQALFDLAGLEGADVGGRELAEPHTAEERHRVRAEAPLVAGVCALGHLVAGRVGDPTAEVVADGEPSRVGEEDTYRLVGEGLELLVVGLRGGVAVEAHTPPAGRGVERGASLLAAVIALARVRTRSVRVLLFRPGHCAMIPGDPVSGPACVKPDLYPAPLHVVLSTMLSRAVMTLLRSL
jgi:hypothetical protein